MSQVFMLNNVIVYSLVGATKLLVFFFFHGGVNGFITTVGLFEEYLYTLATGKE